MQIPKIIHQTWKNMDVPEDFKRMASSWKTGHADWEYRFWTDEMNRNFIRDNFNFFLKKYDGYENNIQRVDAVRYFILYKFGGVYVDMDFECILNITPLLENAQCVFGKEPREHCEIHNKEDIISNAFMAAVPNHIFMKLLCVELEKGDPCIDHPNDRVLESTGPFMLTKLYNSYKEMTTIKLLDPDVIYPLTKNEVDMISGKEISDQAIKEKLKKAYGIHYYAGTWWKNNF